MITHIYLYFKQMQHNNIFLTIPIRLWKQNKKRDNKVMSLNSEDEPESEDEIISVEQEVVKELKKI